MIKPRLCWVICTCAALRVLEVEKVDTVLATKELGLVFLQELMILLSLISIVWRVDHILGVLLSVTHGFAKQNRIGDIVCTAFGRYERRTSKV